MDIITIEPELLLIGSDYVEGLISKMRNIHKSTPPSFRRRENAAAIVKAPPPGALTKGPDRKFPGLHPPLGGATSPSLPTNRRFAFPILALLAALAAGLLFLLPGGLLQAQDDGTIEYAENGTDPVATYTGIDPEGRTVYWSLLAAILSTPAEQSTAMNLGTDADIDRPPATSCISSDGVLSFKLSPRLREVGGWWATGHYARPKTLVQTSTRWLWFRLRRRPRRGTDPPIPSR